ncbi:MAG: M1 family aminopeptidase [Gemmatimonadales bacterium]
MRRSWFAFTLAFSSSLAVVASGQAPAASNIALMANDHYTRSHDFDLIHQRIAVSHFDWDSTAFDGEVTTTLVARRPGLDSVILDEGALLANERIADRAGHALASGRHGDTLVVLPASPLRFGDTLTFTIRYHGRVHSGDGLTFITNDGAPHRPRQIWSQGEDHNNHDWFPTYDFPNDKMTWEVIATVPREDLAISNGRLVSNVVTGAERTMRWSQELPSATYLVSLIVAPLAHIHDTWQGIPVEYYTYHEDSTRAWPLFHVTPDMIGVYSRLTGVKYPWAKYAQTTVADFFGGMENVSATTLVDWLPDSAAYRDRPWYRHILIPHELAHQWFGDYVTTQNWANTWLNEGFAEFMPGQYWSERLGAHAGQDYYLDEYRQFVQIEARRSMPLASLGSNNIYPKGALVLRMLQDYLGPERFWASIHRYLTDHALGTATSEDLRQAFLDATGENLDWFWSEWIYGAGLPSFTVTSSYDSLQRQVALDVMQTQVDSFKPDSTGRLFRVAQAFRMPITVTVGYRGGEVSTHAWIDARHQTITIPGVAAAPTMVLFDDGDHILKQLTFDQPSPWLAEALRRDGNLWDRSWAIKQLAGRPQDSVAARALAEAVTGADYFGTRVDAVQALAEFAPSAALPALLRAAADTSAAVRTAAYETMANFGGDTVSAAATRALAADPSYDVRAAALTTLARTDSGRAYPAIMTGLRTPSYRDVIVNAALAAVAGTNDTAAVPAVDALIGDQENPAHVLAVLGGRGDVHALDLLTRHLDDQRAAVRRWTVSAFGNTMARINKTVALQRLEAAVGSLSHPDTRRSVEELIARLRS